MIDSSLQGVILLVVQSKLAADWLRDRLFTGAELMNGPLYSLQVSGVVDFLCCFIKPCIVKFSSLFELKIGHIISFIEVNIVFTFEAAIFSVKRKMHEKLCVTYS